MPLQEIGDRIKNYKNKGRDVEEMRRRRNETSVELRKAKKEENLLKRRNVVLSDEEDLATSPVHNASKAATLQEIIAGIQGEDTDKQFEATQACRKMLSRERNPPIGDVIKAGVVPRLVTFLQNSQLSELQFEAAWALTNIASGTSEQTKVVVNAGAVPHFIRLLSSSDLTVSEQAVWALGNIAGDGTVLRDFVTKSGILEPLLKLATSSVPAGFMRNITWTISNLCRNKDPPPKFEVVSQCLPALRLLLQHSDREVLADSCWALSYLTDGTNEQIQAVIDSGVVSRLVELLGSNEPSVLTPALRSVGNIVTGNDMQTQAVVDCGALRAFPYLLQHPKCSLQKEAAWALSNITAGNRSQIQAVIDAGLIPHLISLMHRGDFKSQKESVWAITNLTSGGSVEQVGYALEQDCLPPLCALLSAKDTKIILVILDAISNICNMAKGMTQLDSLCQHLEELGAVDKIEQLQEHENQNVYKAAQGLIDNYFGAEDEDGAIAAPEVGEDNTFQFSEQQCVPSEGFNF
ncbi:importin subunit alpha-5-like [Babylonia areolata]|uniref:importin subunit alpha-5-like n=1 Tax=Babylonia areolata TaxID=304850 RepID=UPI003FD5CC04